MITKGSACESTQITASVSPLKEVVLFGFPVASRSMAMVPPSAASRITSTGFESAKHPIKSDMLFPTTFPAKSSS